MLEKNRMPLRWLARTDADGRQPDADSIDEPTPGEVRQQQLVDRLRSVARGASPEIRPGWDRATERRTAIEDANTSRGR
jgi:hypothetical protein